jgi:hypothetical protein
MLPLTGVRKVERTSGTRLSRKPEMALFVCQLIEAGGGGGGGVVWTASEITQQRVNIASRPLNGMYLLARLRIWIRIKPQYFGKPYLDPH